MAVAEGLKPQHSKEELEELQVKAAFQEFASNNKNPDGIQWPKGWEPGSENYKKVFPEEAGALGNVQNKPLENAGEAAAGGKSSESPTGTPAPAGTGSDLTGGAVPAGGTPDLTESTAAPESKELAPVQSKGLKVEGSLPEGGATKGTPALSTGEVDLSEAATPKKGGLRKAGEAVAEAPAKASSFIEGIGTGTLEGAAGKTKVGKAIEKYSPSNLLEKVTKPMSGAIESITPGSIVKGIGSLFGKKKEKALPTEEDLGEESVTTTSSINTPAKSTGVGSDNLNEAGSLPKGGAPTLTGSDAEYDDFGVQITKPLSTPAAISNEAATGSVIQPAAASPATNTQLGSPKRSPLPAAPADNTQGKAAD
jgi:hypothetical protein